MSTSTTAKGAPSKKEPFEGNRLPACYEFELADYEAELHVTPRVVDWLSKDEPFLRVTCSLTRQCFVIAAGSFISSLTDNATAIAEQIGKVKVDMGGTTCKVPYAPDYIQKIKDKDRIGKKRKMARC